MTTKTIKHYHCHFSCYNKLVNSTELLFATNLNLIGLSIEECKEKARSLISKKHYYLKEVTECSINHNSEVLETQKRLIN